MYSITRSLLTLLAPRSLVQPFFHDNFPLISRTCLLFFTHFTHFSAGCLCHCHQIRYGCGFDCQQHGGMHIHQWTNYIYIIENDFVDQLAAVRLFPRTRNIQLWHLCHRPANVDRHTDPVFGDEKISQNATQNHMLFANLTDDCVRRGDFMVVLGSVNDTSILCTIHLLYIWMLEQSHLVCDQCHHAALHPVSEFMLCAENDTSLCKWIWNTYICIDSQKFTIQFGFVWFYFIWK